MTEILKQIVYNEGYFQLGQLPPSKESRPETSQAEKALALEQIREEGYKTGFQQGLTEGKTQGEAQALRENKELRETLKSLINAIPLAVNENRLALKIEIADIVLTITQQFFIQQQQNKEAIAQQITNTLQQINEKQALTLSLHPNDLALLQQGDLKIDFCQYKGLRVTADESLGLGGCIIHSEHGLFNAGIEGQIERLKQVLLELKGENKYV